MSPESQAPDSRRIARLRDDLRIYPADFESWTLFDPVTDRYFKLDASDHALLSRLDRPQTADELAERLAMPRSAILNQLAFLSANGLLESGYGSDFALGAQRERLKGAFLSKWLLQAYLFLDIPLLRPDRFFERSAPFVLGFFNKLTLGVLALISLFGYAMLLPKAERLASTFWNSLDFEGMLGYALALLAIKAVHECAHAYAAKSQGIRVRRMGVAFIVFIPRLYTDITDAWRIPERSRRAIIDGAGIAAELLIGGFMAILWCHSAPGPLNTIAYYIFAVSAINTVFINGNPFIKYDGYYLLMDLVGIDNLYGRGVDLVRRGFRSLALGMKLPPVPEGQRLTGWRKPFIACFAVSSVAYRLVLYTSIILIVYLQFTKALGMVLFALEAYLLLLRPLLAEFKELSRARGAMNPRSILVSAASLFLLVLLSFAPLPWSVSMQCETRSGLTQTLCAKEDGYLLSLDASDGGRLKKGQMVFIQENPFLDWSCRERALEAKAAERELDQIRSDRKRLQDQPSQLKIMERAKESLAELERRKALLQVKAAQDGLLLLYERHLKPGKWLCAGEPIGELFAPESTEAIAYANESDVGGLRIGDKVDLALAGSVNSHYGRVTAVNAVPMKSPSSFSPLLDLVGGPLKTVSSPEDRSLRLLEPLYIVRLSLDSGVDVPAGRTGVAKVRKFHSPGVDFMRWILSTLQRELSF